MDLKFVTTRENPNSINDIIFSLDTKVSDNIFNAINNNCKEKEKDKDKDREKEKDKDKDREKEKDKDREKEKDKDRDKENVEEQQYLNLIKVILDNGYWETGRNGKTKSIFGASMSFSLSNNKIPILTTKKTAWKTCLKELLWFISGKTNNTILAQQNVHIWDGNASREFLDSRGLNHYAVDELGPIYGHQWRHFNAQWEGDIDYTGKGVDQLQQIIEQLKNPATRTSRRLILSAWNPCQLDDMALPPCHILCQFNVHDGNKLSCALYQRSVDTPLGSPINIASYSFLTHLLAKHCGLEAFEFVYFMGNCHIYEEHCETIKTQLSREPFPFPTVSIKELRENIDDYVVDDFVVSDYQHYEAIKMKMVA